MHENMNLRTQRSRNQQMVLEGFKVVRPIMSTSTDEGESFTIMKTEYKIRV